VIVTEVWHWTPLFFLILLSGLNAIRRTRCAPR
jgi:multiple sugar transport system permease protein